MPAVPQQPIGKRDKPEFDPNEVTVIFVLGGPGAGKGTQCSNLVRDYTFKHLSAGDLLREEQERAGSEFGEMIKEYIREGKIVPMEVTIQLLENAMKAAIATENKKKFLIDGMIFASLAHLTRWLTYITGFPRKLDQAHAFENSVCPAQFTLFFDCPESVMEERLLNRGKTSGRSDDNIDSIRKRFKTFVETSMPVVDEFESQGRVVKVDATQAPAEVYEVVKAKFLERGISLPK